ncbi:MAG: glycosyltransferase family 39 protein [Dermatophilaceae bacterium]
MRIFGLSSLEHARAAGAHGRREPSACSTLAVRRVAGAAAGLVAGAVLALTPVAALMFRFNNPDALLVLLLVAPRRTTTVRATEQPRRCGGSSSTGVLVGFAFLTKMLQAFLVAARVRARLPGRRARRRCAAGSSTWCVAGVAMVVVGRLVDRARRAVAGGEPPLHRRLADQLGPRADHGLQRPRPDHRRRDRQRGGRAAPAAPASGRDRAGTGCFSASYGGQIAWLIPAALRARPARCSWSRGARRAPTAPRAVG